MAEKFANKKIQKEVEKEESKLGKSNSLGLFGDVDDDGEEVIDNDRERGIERDMAGVPLTIGRFKIRPLTLSAFALLRQIDSAFLTFTPLLSEDDRELLVKLSEKKSRTEQEENKFMRLMALARAESELIKNPYLETLKFFAIMSNDVEEEEAEELAFLDDKGITLRRAALEFGQVIEPHEMDDLTIEIGTRVSEAQESKVVPSKKKGSRNQKPKRKKATPTRRRSLRK